MIRPTTVRTNKTDFSVSSTWEACMGHFAPAFFAVSAGIYVLALAGHEIVALIVKIVGFA